jgi:polyisoprenoid-binding protein YceI
MTSTTDSVSGSRDWRGLSLPTPGTFTVDPSHTRVGFVARHLMVTKVRGSFAEVEGSVVVADDPLASTAQATMQAASITTGSPDRDTHLRSGDFLLVDEHPTVSYRSTGITGVSGDTFTVEGELTIRGVTRPVTLAVEVDGVAKDPWGGERLSLTARGEINREDFGLTWNVALEGGGVLVSKKATLEIEAQLVRQS